MENFGAVCFLGETDNTGEKKCRRIYSAVDKILQSGACSFIFCADTYFGLACARQILLRKRKQQGDNPDFINLVAAIPYEEHIGLCDEDFRNEYFDVLSRCDSTVCFARNEEEFIEADFIQAIIDLSDIIICAENKTEYARLYATAVNKKIIGIS